MIHINSAKTSRMVLWITVLLTVVIIVTVVTGCYNVPPPSAPAPAPAPAPPTNQIINIPMSPGSVTTSSVTYTNRLVAGEKVEGFVRLTDTYASVDWSHTCCVKVFDPKTTCIFKNCGEFQEGGFYRDFDFNTRYEGDYRIQIQHWSNYSRDLYIEICPAGWSRV